jgi:hypothetical protein
MKKTEADIRVVRQPGRNGSPVGPGDNKAHAKEWDRHARSLSSPKPTTFKKGR